MLEWKWLRAYDKEGMASEGFKGPEDCTCRYARELKTGGLERANWRA